MATEENSTVEVDSDKLESALKGIIIVNPASFLDTSHPNGPTPYRLCTIEP